MMSGLPIHVAFCLAMLAADDGPWTLETTVSQRIQTVYTLDYEAPNLTPQEWEFFLAQPPELPGQTDVRMTCEPAAAAVRAKGDFGRPLQRMRVTPADPQAGRQGHIMVKCEATLRARKLVAGSGALKSSAAPALAPNERTWYLASTATIDYAAPDFKAWLDTEKLQRRDDESKLAFARRAFLSLKQRCGYDYVEKMDRHPAAVCRAGKSDCGGLSILYVATLRAAGVPARVLVGRWAKSAVAGEKVGDMAYFQQHVKAEFFVEPLGWVPVDLASGVQYDRTPAGLANFGRDAGDFLVLHVDGDLVVDTHSFGEQTIPWLQGAAYWVTGTGSAVPITARENWQVFQRQ